MRETRHLRPEELAEPPILSISDLRIEGFDVDQHAWVPIVKGVDLSVRRGEILGLVGESGAGKSMIGLSAMGYARPGCRIVGGEIRFDGIDLRRASSAELDDLRGRRISYVAQSAIAAFNPAHRLLDQLCEVSVRHNITDHHTAAAQARALVTRLQLPNPATIGARFPHQLSGGQLQRMMTAMAMVCQPDLIIFDEPTTALDVTTQIEVLAAIREAVRSAGAAALFISHDLAVVAQMTERIMVLRRGVSVEENDTRAILATPSHDYTKSLWAVRALHKEAPAAAAEPDVVLDVQSVSASYGAVPILKDICCTLRRGRTLAAVGESGSGKSTLARTVAGLLAPASGTVTFRGERLPPLLKHRSLDQLRRIQLIYQSPDTALNPRQTVLEALGRPLQLYFGTGRAARRQEVARLLDMVELPSTVIDRKTTELSGGQKQRLCIARALAARPELIICDEITSGLDQLVAESILRLLDSQQREIGVAYLFITHDLATVNAIADDVIVMQNGRIVEAGPKAEVMSRPRMAYTKLLLSSVPEMDCDWLTNLLASRGEGDGAGL